MEIHSSSINYSALRLSPKITGRDDVAQKRPDESRAALHDPGQRPSSETQTTEEIESLLTNNGLSNINGTNLTPIDSAINKRMINAINTYNDTFHQTMQDQRSQLIVGVDLYV